MITVVEMAGTMTDLTVAVDGSIAAGAEDAVHSAIAVEAAEVVAEVVVVVAASEEAIGAPAMASGEEEVRTCVRLAGGYHIAMACAVSDSIINRHA